jgi:hypothetical protein
MSGNRAVSILLLLSLAACAEAPSPQSINASYVSSIPYQSWSCAQLGEEQQSLDTALANASTREETIRSNERARSVAAMFVPMPPTSGSEDVTSQVEIAHVKGEREAVRQAMAHNSCQAPIAAS